MTNAELNRIASIDLATLRRVVNHVRRACDDLKENRDMCFDDLEAAADDTDVSPLRFETHYLKNYDVALARYDTMRELLEDLETMYDGLRIATRL